MVLDIAAALGREEPQKFVPEVEEEDEECKIYVNNIPDALRGKGLRNFFQKFGKIIKLYYPSGNRWAFVTYSNKAECEMAIMRIQEVFGMSADFAKKKEKREVEELIDELPWEQSQPKDDEAEKKVTPFILPTVEYEFPPLLVTEEDYKHPAMIKFDPKKEFLLSHDMFWVDRLKKEFGIREKKASGGKEISNKFEDEKIFSLHNSKELPKLFPMDCVICNERKALFRTSKDKKVLCSSKCKKMLGVRNSEESVTFPRNKSLVMAVYNPREIFLRSLDSDTNANYVKLINQVQHHSKTAEFLSKPPESYSMAIAKRGNIFTRAFVVSHDSETGLSTVILIDFGDIERIPWNELKEINEKLASEPRYIFRVNLKDVNALEYNNLLKDFLRHNYLVKKIIYSDLDAVSIPEVTLKTDEDGELTVNEKMKRFLERTEKEIDFRTYNFRDVKDTEVWPVKNVEIIILDNSHLHYGLLSVAIYWQYIESLHQWQVMQNQCESLGEKFVPVEDDTCLVKLVEDEKWHRAICIGGNHHRILNVFLMDSGVRGAVSTSNVRKLPCDFNFPRALKICKIKGLPDDVPKEKVEELKDLLPHNKRMIAKELLDLGGEEYYQLTLDL